MKKILLYGGDTEDMALPLCRALSGYGGVLFCGGGHICEYGDTRTRFAVVAPDRLLGFSAESSVILLDSPLPADLPGCFAAERVFAVVEYADAAALKAAARAGLAAVTFGASRGDLSLSSFDGVGASVCVSRELVTTDGESVSPCEILVRTAGGLSARQLPALAAVLVLCGCERGGVLTV